MAIKIPVAVFWAVAVLAVVVVAEEAGTGWQESVNAAAGDVKVKAEEAVEGAKAWTGWAVGKLSEKFIDEKKDDETISTTTTEKLGEVKEKVVEMATGTQEKANEVYEKAKETVSGNAKAEKANEAYESAKETVSSHAKAGLDAVKEKTVEVDEKAHNEL